MWQAELTEVVLITASCLHKICCRHLRLMRGDRDTAARARNWRLIMDWSCFLRICARGVAPSGHLMLVRFRKVGYFVTPSAPAQSRSRMRSSQASVFGCCLHASVHEASHRLQNSCYRPQVRQPGSAVCGNTPKTQTKADAGLRAGTMHALEHSHLHRTCQRLAAKA